MSICLHLDHSGVLGTIHLLPCSRHYADLVSAHLQFGRVVKTKRAHSSLRPHAADCTRCTESLPPRKSRHTWYRVALDMPWYLGAYLRNKCGRYGSDTATQGGNGVHGG